MFHKDGNRRRTWRGRAFSLFLTAALLLGSVPGLALPAAAAHWAAPYLDQLVDWGVMRADQTGNPDAPLTRAEFMAIVNRAYGYKEVGPIPFTDVTADDWFYDDVAIAYTAGYMKGTSETTASPNDRLTREQAVCILGRNMMLKETPGEDLSFTDSRSISGWAKGMVKTAVDNYIVAGYPDDTFRPKADITKGQMAVLVTQCVGAPVNAGGTYELGGVFGNVTVTAPNVTLRNTTVSGDLYVSGGVGLGGVKLENVDVLGRIVVSGTGESESGSASVIMRNVNANELLVDNMRNKYVTVQADGITEINKTIVRTNAYLEDNNTDDKGLLEISLEGKSGTRLDLAGRIKKVVDKTPNSFIQVAKGSVQSITVDEAATNSVIQINRNTKVQELNLDVAANVNGEGDIGKLNVNAPGSTVTMLPDDIYIRPGITGNVNGMVMDSAAAEESSLDPRLLSGYPMASDVAPTSFRADFAGNKKGTVYWAVSSIADGSIGAEDLISPPSYGSKAVRGGSVGLPAGDTVGSTQISGLTVGGSYYLSAVLVDARDERSPVKVISFTTPDNTVPDFAQGYPYMSLITNTMAQVTVMPTKTCKLYYAVLPKGAPAPTPSEMRSAAVTGNLGYGVVDVVKNTERVINVSSRLQELKEYTLYLWLTDADGVNSSKVVPVQFKTVDKTPPKFSPDPDPSNAVEEDTSVELSAGLNEPGTIYWVAVPRGKAYPPANSSNPNDNTEDENGNAVSKLTSEYAKNQVKNHGRATIFGSVKVAKADTEVAIKVDKLQPATAYDFYYVAQDTANNFSDTVKKITIRTKDTVGPVVTQYFRDTTKGEELPVPRSGDEVILKFNEEIQVDGKSLLDLYTSKLLSDMEKVLQENFKLYYLDDRGNPVQVEAWTNGTTAATWVNYRNVVVRRVEDDIEVVFVPSRDALKLVSGREYYFELTKIADMSGNNPKGFERVTSPVLRYDTVGRTEHVLPTFTVAPASVKLSRPSTSQLSPQPVWQENKTSAGTTLNEAGKENGGLRNGKELARVDGRFFVDPEATEEMGDTYYYDIVLFSEKAISYDVYYRILDPEKDYGAVQSGGGSKFDENRIRQENTTDDVGWAYLGNVASRKTNSRTRDVGGVVRDARQGEYAASINNLKLLKTLGQNVRYEFAISVTELNSSSAYSTWGDKFKVHVSVIAGAQARVNSVLTAGSATEENIGTNSGISVISDPFYITMEFNTFDAPPNFSKGPVFNQHYDGTPTAQMEFALDNPGTLYYMIRPKNRPFDTTDITTKKNVYKLGADTEIIIPTGTRINASSGVNAGNSEDTTWQDMLWRVVSAQTSADNCGKLENDGYLEYYSISGPLADDVSNSDQSKFIVYDRTDRRTDKVTLEFDEEWVANGDYYIYIVLEPKDSSRKSEVYIYNFKSGEIEKPKLELSQRSTEFTVVTKYRNDKGESVGGASKLNWKMFHQDEASAALSGTFVRGKGAADYPGVVTILDALTKPFESSQYPDTTFGETYNGYTVFDVLASDADKRTIWALINEGNSPVPYGDGKDQNTNRNGSWTNDWLKAAQTAHPDDEFIKNQTFLILVGGRHPDSADTPDYTSFRLMQNVSNADLSAPVLKNANIRNLKLTWDDTYQRPIMSGSMNLIFDSTKPVYWRKDRSENDSTYYRVISGTGGPSGSGDSATVGLLYNVGSDAPFHESTGGFPNYVLGFQGAEGGSNYPLLSGWGLFAKNGSDPGTDLQVSFETEYRKREEVDPNTGVVRAIHEWRGVCKVTYSHTVKSGTYSSATEWYDEDILKGIVVAPTPPKLLSAIIPKSYLNGFAGTARIQLDFDKPLYDDTGKPISDITKYCTVNGAATLKLSAGGTTGKYTIDVSNIDADGSTITVLQGVTVYEGTMEACTQMDIKIEVKLEDPTTGVLSTKLAWAKVSSSDLKQPVEAIQTPTSTRRS